MSPNDPYKQRVKQAILDAEHFVSAAFGGRRADGLLPWIKASLRPVLIKGARRIQFSYFDARRDITRNYGDDEASARLDELLDMGFRSIHVQTTRVSFRVQITKKGKAIVHEDRAESPALPDLSHDRRKNRVFSPDRPDAFLQAVGIMAPDGKIKAGMQDKFTQINQFLEIVSHTGELKDLSAPLYVVDCGCGSAYLTFAVYHYLNDVLGLPTRMTGVDIKADLLAGHADKVAALGWVGLDFEAARIIDFQPPVPPDIVLALHACDTATDEALAQAITWGSRLIFSAPCCHHHLQAQLDAEPLPLSFKPILRHGILKERMGDILTDSLRALILRIMGYRADVMEFVSAEHTDKNLMIRAVKTAQPGERRFVEEYIALKAFWQVTPYLEDLLGEPLTALL